MTVQRVKTIFVAVCAIYALNQIRIIIFNWRFKPVLIEDTIDIFVTVVFCLTILVYMRAKKRQVSN
jgi:hypothetical protein